MEGVEKTYTLTLTVSKAGGGIPFVRAGVGESSVLMEITLTGGGLTFGLNRGSLLLSMKALKVESANWILRRAARKVLPMLLVQDFRIVLDGQTFRVRDSSPDGQTHIEAVFPLQGEENEVRVKVDLHPSKGSKASRLFKLLRLEGTAYFRDEVPADNPFTEEEPRYKPYPSSAEPPASHGTPVTDGLASFVGFREGSGIAACDSTDADGDLWLEGDTAWGPGYAAVVGKEGRLILYSPDVLLRSAAFTWDLWFEAGEILEGGRLISQVDRIGGVGPDLFVMDGHLCFRIGGDCRFDVPNVGFVHISTDETDSWAVSTRAVRANEGVQHLVLIHDPESRDVAILLSAPGIGDLDVVFCGKYHGSYSVVDVPIVLGNCLHRGRTLLSKFYQFIYYCRVLSLVEANDNHMAGPQTCLPRE